MVTHTTHTVNQTIYNNLIQPSKTRSGIPPIKNIPIEKRRLSHNAILNSNNRVFNAHGFGSSAFSDADADAGKYYYIHLDAYDESPNAMRIIDEVSPLLVNPATFETGAYYTYVVASIVGKDPVTKKTVTLSQFPSIKGTPLTPPFNYRQGVRGDSMSPAQLYAVKVVNIFELGAKHHQIFYRMALKDEALFAELKVKYDKIEYRLYAAGEIMCTSEDTLIFNFYSGTYKMKQHISDKRVTYEEAFVTHMMRDFSPKYTNIHFKYCPFITNDTVPLTKKELARLRRHNISLFLFDTPNQCNSMRNAVFRHKISNKNHPYVPPTCDELQQMYKCINSQ
jgi:hypothetical protein